MGQEFATTTLLVHTTITLTAPASVITEIANASTYTFGTASFATDAVTIPIPSGFVPIESTLPTAGVAKRHIAERAADPPAGHQTIFPAGIRPEGAPKSVVCNTVIHSTVTVTSTTTAIVKKLAAGTKTATSELTVTQVCTEVFQICEIRHNSILTDLQLHHNFPNHPGKTITKTSIISITSHTTPLTTVTTTPTVTVTDVLPEATFYAACAANNLVSQVNDYPVDGFALAATSISDQQTSNIVQYTDVNATSSYDCCVMAQQTTDSTVFFYTGSDFGVQNGQCLVFISDACPVPGDQTEIYGAVYNGTASQLGGDYHAYMGNAGCGVGVTSATNFTIWTQAQSLGLEGGGVTAGSQAGTQLTNAG